MVLSWKLLVGIVCEHFYRERERERDRSRMETMSSKMETMSSKMETKSSKIETKSRKMETKSSKVVYEGWMVRCGRRKIGRAFIHMRYFVLEPQLLAYYKKKPQTNQVHISSLNHDFICHFISLYVLFKPFALCIIAHWKLL